MMQMKQIFLSSNILNETFLTFIFNFTNLTDVDDYYILSSISLSFFPHIGSRLLINSIEMPQLGQLGPLMAVIAPCFTNMSLMRLTVCLLLCFELSLLIKPKLNDQRCLCVEDHHSSTWFERNLQGLFKLPCSGY